MKKLLLPFCIFFFTTLSFAQTNHETITAEFISKYEHNTDMALDYFFGTNPWMKNNVAGTATIKQQINEMEAQMGTYIGFQKLSEEMIGDSLVYLVYMVKYERQPLRFMFQYYKANDTWIAFHISFDENLLEELKSE